MKEKLISFNTDLVYSILCNAKTQTRRLLKPQSIVIPQGNIPQDWYLAYGSCYKNYESALQYSPYQFGDILWVRESAKVVSKGRSGYREAVIEYCADNTRATVPYPERLAPIPIDRKLANGTYREACRIRLEVTNIRVERLQEIGRLDAIAEGIKDCTDFEDTNYEENYYQIKFGGKRFNSAVEAYQNLWESIYGNGSWEANPFVWVIEFKKIQPR